MNKKNTISKDTIVRRIENIDATDLNGEKVMMNLEKGQYFALNEVGSRIWDVIDKPTSVGEITNVLLSEYEIDADTCIEAVLDFLGKMNDAELISVS